MWERLFASAPRRELIPPPTPLPVNQAQASASSPSVVAPCQATAQPPQPPQPSILDQLFKRALATNPSATRPPSTPTLWALPRATGTMNGSACRAIRQKKAACCCRNESASFSQTAGQSGTPPPPVCRSRMPTQPASLAGHGTESASGPCQNSDVPSSTEPFAAVAVKSLTTEMDIRDVPPQAKCEGPRPQASLGSAARPDMGMNSHNIGWHNHPQWPVTNPTEVRSVSSAWPHPVRWMYRRRRKIDLRALAQFLS